MRFFALSLLLLSACGPAMEPHCVTALGMKYMGEWKTGEMIDDWKYSCDYFQETETSLIQNLGTTYSERMNIDATRLRGVQIWLMNKPDWVDDYGRHVAGVSYCVNGYMHINNAIFAEWSSFPHEMLHFMQNCAAVLPIDPNLDIDHANWTRDGFYDAIAKTRRY